MRVSLHQSQPRIPVATSNDLDFGSWELLSPRREMLKIWGLDEDIYRDASYFISGLGNVAWGIRIVVDGIRWFFQTKKGSAGGISPRVIRVLKRNRSTHQGAKRMGL